MRTLLEILFWSVIAAAFIGPGTVTVAASAGAAHGYALLWALLFSTLACFVLQEASARLAILSGQDLAGALRGAFGKGLGGWLVRLLVLGAIGLGCAAYEAGNILGGVAGAALVLPVSTPVLTLACGAVAALLLWWGSPAVVARSLSFLVATMGTAFLVTAIGLAPDAGALLTGLLLPRVPEGGILLAVGLVGTTVVPYNLFLGSGLAAGRDLRVSRIALAVAVGLGGVISMGVLVVGAAVDGPFSFAALAGVLEERLGSWAGTFFAVGLLAAGLSSAVTAPLAAAVTARGVFGGGPRWRHDGWWFRSVWLAVLGTGIAFGLSGIKPVPAIVLAQVLNGILLPLSAVFLLIVVNDRRVLATGLNGPLANVLMAVVVGVTIVLGVSSLLRALATILDRGAPSPSTVLGVALASVIVVAVPTARELRRRRRASDD